MHPATAEAEQEQTAVVDAILVPIRISLRNAAETFGMESRQYREIAGMLREEAKDRVSKATGRSGDGIVEGVLESMMRDLEIKSR